MNDEITAEYIRNLRRRFNEKFLRGRPGDHWPWFGFIDPENGHGRIWRSPNKAPWTIQQAVWIIHFRRLPTKPIITCPILKTCCNWRHIAEANSQDMGDRSLFARQLSRGKKRVRTTVPKLSDEEIHTIFYSTEPTSELAERFHVSPAYVSNVKHGRKGQKALRRYQEGLQKSA